MSHTNPVHNCLSSSFAIPSPFNTTITSITTSLVQNYTTTSPAPPFANPNHGTIAPKTLSFCNVTVIHTHPGVNDAVQTQIWLPTTTWNGRMQGVGGGGYIAGLYGYIFSAMDAAIAEGYAAISTNAGLYGTDINGGDADQWALRPDGTINLDYGRNFADRSLLELGLLGKSTIKSYYGCEPVYSYWSGCSGGGRQGYVLAQEYPGLFDGIAAGAPGLYWDEWVEWYWAQQTMNERGAYPRPCEFDTLREKMLEACDGLDGVEDGILQVPEQCEFDPRTLIGKSIKCEDAPGGSVRISETAADIAAWIWTDEKPAGVNLQGQTAGYDVELKYNAGTTCFRNGTCTGNPNPISTNWMKVFVKKDTRWDPSNMTTEEFESLRQQSVDEYHSLLGVSDYSLAGFKQAGSKLITYQGTSDPAISYKNTRRFYNAATELDSAIHDYYRLFLAPGLGHCIGGPGAYPNTTFHALVDWVEKGKAPDSLQATSMPDESGRTINRVLCAYPKRAVWDGKGDLDKFESWTCTD